MTVEMNRRGLLTGLASLVAAPAIVRVQSIMPVRTMLPLPLVAPPPSFVLREWQIGVAYVAGDVVVIDGHPHVCTYGLGPEIQSWESLADRGSWVRSARLMGSHVL